MGGHIPENFIAELLARVDIVDVIDARVPLKKAGKDYKACCPFHEERTPSFTVSPDKQFFHCFGCGAHGSAIGFLMQYEHLPFPEAVEQLARRAGLEVPKSAHTARPEEDRLRESLEGVLMDADRFFRRQLREHPQARVATDYLKSRGLTGEIAAAFGLGFAPDGWDNLLRAIGTDDARRNLLVQAGLAVRKDDGGLYDRFRARVMFPIHDYRGKLVGFGGRVIGAGEPKYLNSPETPLFHKGRELYGLYRARDAIARENKVLVVEGYMDVVSLAQFGYDGAVATLGTATTRDHLERLYRYCPEIVFCFDGDRAGRAAAWRALENALPVLRDGREASFLFLPEGEDPDTLVRKEGADRLRERIAAAKPLPDYFFEHLSEQTDLSRLDGRARLVKLAEPFLAKLPAGVLAAMMRARLAEIARLDPAALPAPPPRSRLTPPVRKATSAGVRARDRTVLAHTLALLIQRPDLAGSVDKSLDINRLDSPLAPLWHPLLDFLVANPTSRAGVVCEHFRDTEFAAAVGDLAARPLPEHPDTELADAMKQLARAINREEMLSKAASGVRPSDMSDQTKATLRRLGARKNELDRR
jgi:DNA primase